MFICLKKNPTKNIKIIDTTEKSGYQKEIVNKKIAKFTFCHKLF